MIEQPIPQHSQFSQCGQALLLVREAVHVAVLAPGVPFCSTAMLEKLFTVEPVLDERENVASCRVAAVQNRLWRIRR